MAADDKKSADKKVADNITEDGYIKGGWNDSIHSKVKENVLQFLHCDKENKDLYLNNHVINIDSETFKKYKNLRDYALATQKLRSKCAVNIVFGLNTKEIESFANQVSIRIESNGPALKDNPFALKSFGFCHYVLIKSESNVSTGEEKNNNNDKEISKSGRGPIFYTLEKDSDKSNVIKFKNDDNKDVTAPSMIGFTLDYPKQLEQIEKENLLSAQLFKAPNLITFDTRFVLSIQDAIGTGVLNEYQIFQGGNAAPSEPGFYFIGHNPSTPTAPSQSFNILYIGETTNIHDRFFEHARGIASGTGAYQNWVTYFPSIQTEMNAGNIYGVYVATSTKQDGFFLEQSCLRNGQGVFNTLFNVEGLPVSQYPFVPYSTATRRFIEIDDFVTFLKTLVNPIIPTLNGVTTSIGNAAQAMI